MLYDYSCNKCLQKYTRSNTIENRNKSGRCPYCTSKDTKKAMSTPMFKTSTSGAHGGKTIC